MDKMRENDRYRGDAGASNAAHADQRGVTDTEIIIEIPTNLSGPAASHGLGSVRAAQMRADEINAAGGIHGAPSG